MFLISIELFLKKKMFVTDIESHFRLTYSLAHLVAVIHYMYSTFIINCHNELQEIPTPLLFYNPAHSIIQTGLKSRHGQRIET